MDKGEYEAMVQGIMMNVEAIMKLPPKPVYTLPKEIKDATTPYVKQNIGFKRK